MCRSGFRFDFITENSVGVLGVIKNESVAEKLLLNRAT